MSSQSYIDQLNMDPKVLGNKAITGTLIWLGLEYGGLTSYIVSPYDNSLMSALKIGAYGAFADSVGGTLRSVVPQLKLF